MSSRAVAGSSHSRGPSPGRASTVSGADSELGAPVSGSVSLPISARSNRARSPSHRGDRGRSESHHDLHRAATAPLGATSEPPALSKLKVVCRLRPMSDQEKRCGTMPAITASTERKEIMAVRAIADQTRQARLAFHFDHILTSFSTQLDVFAVTLKPLVKEVLAGYEAAVFAYGQTGTGKTYTMEGNVNSEMDRGLVPRAAEALIRALAQGSYSNYTVTASCLEIYNEELIDLLAPQSSQQKLDLKEGGKGVQCIGLSEVPVASVGEIQAQIRRAQERRNVAETRVNARSSRSHCLFTLKVCCTKSVADGQVEACGKLHLVDLAGSECARNADERCVAGNSANQEAASKGERERKNINQSLLTLNRVISSLRSNQPRIPYRDSKLTRMLQSALGGGCQTVMIATISPAQNAIDETISTLQYAEQASGIQSRPVAATMFSSGRTPVGFGGEMGFGLAGTDGRAETQELEMRLEYLTQEVEEAHVAFERKRCEAQELQAQVEATETKLLSTVSELKDAQQVAEERSYACNAMAQFADDRSDEVGRLVNALDSARSRCSNLVEESREKDSTAAAMRKQARDICTNGEHHATTVAAAVRSAADVAIQAAEESCQKHGAGVEAMSNFATKQDEVLNSLASAVSTHGDDLSRHLTEVVCKLRNDGSDQGDVAQAESSAASGEDANAFRCLLADLQDLLLKDTEVAEKNYALAGEARSQAIEDSVASGERRDTLRNALQGLMDTHSANCMSHTAPLNQSLEFIENSVASRAATMDAAFASLADQLNEVRRNLSATHASGQDSVANTLASADQTLTGMWADLSGQISQVNEVVGLARTEIVSSNIGNAEVEALTSARAALADSVQQSVAELAAAREVVLSDLDTITQQLSAEKDVVAQLTTQRETLVESVTEVRASLSSIVEGAQVARAGLAAIEEQQRHRRQAALENILEGVRELVSGEMNNLQSNLADGTVSVASSVEQIENASTTAESTLEAARGKCLEVNNCVADSVSALAARSRSACSSAQASEENAANVVKNLDEAIITVSKTLSDIGGRVQAWGSACESVSANLDNAVGLVGILRETQDKIHPQWSSASADLTGATTVIFNGIDAAVVSVDAAVVHNQAASQDMTAFRDELAGHQASATDRVGKLASDQEHHSRELMQLAALRGQHDIDGAAAESTRCSSIQALVDVCADASAAAARSRSCLEGSWQEVSTSVETACAAGKLAEGTLEGHEADIGSVRAAAAEAEVAHQRAIAALHAQKADVQGFAELPSLWRDGVASAPMAAYQDRDDSKDSIYEDAEGAIPEVTVDLTTRPTEEELIALFRQAASSPRATNDTIDPENQLNKQVAGKRPTQVVRGAPLRELQASALVI